MQLLQPVQMLRPRAPYPSPLKSAFEWSGRVEWGPGEEPLAQASEEPSLVLKKLLVSLGK
jgi:hypothetical protein